jgi:PAS domain-containing protein
VFSVKRGDGTEIAAETSVKLIEDKYATFVIIILRDVSERLKAEEAVREARDKLEATVQAIPDIMFEVDMEGRIYDYHSPTHGALVCTARCISRQKGRRNITRKRPRR